MSDRRSRFPVKVAIAHDGAISSRFDQIAMADARVPKAVPARCAIFRASGFGRPSARVLSRSLRHEPASSHHVPARQPRGMRALYLRYRRVSCSLSRLRFGHVQQAGELRHPEARKVPALPAAVRKEARPLARTTPTGRTEKARETCQPLVHRPDTATPGRSDLASSKPPASPRGSGTAARPPCRPSHAPPCARSVSGGKMGRLEPCDAATPDPSRQPRARRRSPADRM